MGYPLVTKTLMKHMARTVKIGQIQDAVKGAKTLRDALAKVIAAGYAPIEVNLFRAMLAYFDLQPNCEVSEVHQHYVEYLNKAKNKTRCEIADLLVISFSESRCTMRASFIQVKREVVPQVRNKFRFHLTANQYQLLYNCPIIDPKGTGLPANILRDACSDAISSYGVFYRSRQNYEFAYEITKMLQPSQPKRQAGSMTCSFSTKQLLGGYACRIPQQSLQYCGTPFGQCAPILLSSINTNHFEDALSKGLIGSPIIGSLAKQLIKFITDLHSGAPSKHAHFFANFISKFQDFWREDGNEMHYIPNRRDDDDNNRREEGDSNNIEWMMPRYVMLVNADRAEYRQPEV